MGGISGVVVPLWHARATVLALLSLLAYFGVDAQEVPSWNAPPECPDAAWVQARVAAYLRRPVDEHDAALNLHARVFVGADGRFELELPGAADLPRQRLSHHDCTALADVAASLVAITVDPLALLVDPGPLPSRDAASSVGAPRPVRVQYPSSRPAREPSPRPRPRRAAESVPKPEPEPLLTDLELIATAAELDHPPDDRHTRLLVLADAGLALGVFPGVAPTVHGGLGLESRGVGQRVGVRASVQGGAVLAGRFRGPEDTRGGDLSAWNVVARPCLVPRWGIVDLRACAVLGAGQLRGRGVGVVDPQLGTQPWIWARAELGLAVAVHHNVALMLDLGGGANLLRPRFVLSDPAASYTVPAPTAHASLGLELRVF